MTSDDEDDCPDGTPCSMVYMGTTQGSDGRTYETHRCTKCGNQVSYCVG